MRGDLWTPDELAIDTREAARRLLGAYLVRELDGEMLVGRIVETEAYLGAGDPGSHAARGETPRCRAMFGPPGRAYVYRIYGVHHCFNVVTEPEGTGAAVLVRALEPIQGEAVMRARRGSEALTNGPGRICQALGIDRALDGVDLTRRGPLYLLHGEAPQEAIATTTRIGLTQGAELPLRYILPAHPWLSRPR
ncbi:MAG TPA: DNA-3-methyladenine glycosylase [Oscillatoriaceae cyanobacterium]